MTTTIGSLIDEGVIQVTTGFASGEHNQDGIGVPHMRPFNVTPGGRMSLAQVKSVPAPKATAPLLARGDVLFNNTNTAELVGKTAYFDIDMPYAFSNHMTRVRVLAQKRMSSRFLALALHREWTAGQSQQLCRQHVAQASIIGERFRELAFELPALKTQERIAAVLALIQRAIAIEEKTIETARELKQATMATLFGSGLRREGKRETEIGPLPLSWDLLPFVELREFLQYGTSVKCEYAAEGDPVLRIPNIVNGHIDYSDLKRCALDGDTVTALQLKEGDVLFIRTNGVRERVGTCAVYEGEPERSLFASYLIRARPKRGVLNSRFLQYYTATAVGASFLAGRSSPAADGKFNINTKTIDSVLVPLPSPGEQNDIVGVLETIDAFLTSHERSRVGLTELFLLLLDELMTGQIQVDKLNIDLSEVVAA